MGVVGAGLRPSRRKDNRDRPWHDPRAMLNAVLWVLGTGAQWAQMPDEYPVYQTCHHLFQGWIRDRDLMESLRLLARHLHERGKLNLDEAPVDATFASAKKRACIRRVKGTKIAAGDGLPLAVSVEGA